MKYRYDVWATPTVRIDSGTIETDDGSDAVAVDLHNEKYPDAHSIIVTPIKNLGGPNL